MKIRRRYDTAHLIAQIRRQRRNGLFWVGGGVCAMCLLLAVYVRGVGGEAPVVGDGGAPTPAPSRVARPLDAKSSQPVVSQVGVRLEVEAKARPSPPSSVVIRLKRKGFLWIDGHRFGRKVKRLRLALAPGEHTLKVRMGKKVIEGMLAVEEGRDYDVRFDPRDREPQVRQKLVGGKQ